MMRSCYTSKNAQSAAFEDDRVTEPDRGIPCPEPDSDAWESPGRVALYLLLKKRMEDTFRTGKENGFRKFFRNWLSADGFGICRPCRNPTPKYAQAMKAIQRIPASQIASIAAFPTAQQLKNFTQAGNVSCGGGPIGCSPGCGSPYKNTGLFKKEV